MDFTDINDPAGVKALLERLRASQAWQQTIANPSGSVPASHGDLPAATPTGFPSTGFDAPSRQGGDQQPSVASSSGPTTSVASLLSQLNAGHLPPVTITPGSHSSLHLETPSAAAGPGHAIPATASSPFSARKPPNLRSCTFQQALPVLAQLSEDQTFVAAITTMKNEQVDLERRLWDERRTIQKSQEEKVKKARTKASVIGVGLTQYEADAMTESFRRELHKFDSERALSAWDGLISKQQAELENLGVPCMFTSTVLSDREKQQRVMQVLEGIE